jgi:hypothetical protein
MLANYPVCLYFYLMTLTQGLYRKETLPKIEIGLNGNPCPLKYFSVLQDKMEPGLSQL